MHLFIMGRVLLVALLVAGCAATRATNSDPGAASHDATSNPTSSSGPRKVTGKDGYAGEVIGQAAPKSKFSKLQIGMSHQQVEDLIGKPTEEKRYQTGKIWIPIAGVFSQDQVRLEAYYKGEGRLVFALNGQKLYRIEVDVTEDGYQ